MRTELTITAAISLLALTACGQSSNAPYRCFSGANEAYSELPEDVRQKFESLSGEPYSEKDSKDDVEDLFADGFERTVDQEKSQVYQNEHAGILVNYAYQSLDLEAGQLEGWFVKNAVLTVGDEDSDLNCAVRGEGYDWNN